MDEQKRKNISSPGVETATALEAASNAASSSAPDTTPQSNEEDANSLNRQYRRMRKYSPHSSTGPTSWSVDDNVWMRKGSQHWTDTGTGLAAIEFISRITLGGMFYSWMNNSAMMSGMKSYDPSTYDSTKAGALEKIAHGLDRTIGVGIKKIHMGFSGDEKAADRFIRFRENRLDPKPGPPGRSLGAEMTVVTADFAAMSAGSAIMRNALLGIFNPRERRAWLDKEGRFSLSHAGKRLGSKAWEIVSYNAGEDAAVALPYVFALRGIRNYIDRHMSPGFKWGSDAVDNGGSVVVNRHGSVMGDHQLAGAADLQARFTIYNVFTQYYRDFYNYAARSFRQWRENDYTLETPHWVKSPTSIPGRILDTATGSLRYLAISMIRSILQMTPTVPFFWAIRVPASKNNGMAVHPDFGVMVNKDGKPLRAGQAYLPDGSKHPDYAYTPGYQREFYWSNRFDDNGNRMRVSYETADIHNRKVIVNAPNPFADRANGPFEAYGFSNPGRRLHHSGIARLTDKVGTEVHKLADKSIWNKMSGGFWKLVDPKGDQTRHNKLARDAALAGMPYASYFAAKVYFREMYVNDQMNMAIGRALDGLAKFDFREVKEGLNEITKTMQGLPLTDPERQAMLIENHRYNPQDKSPIPADWNRDLHEKYLKKVEGEDKEITSYDLAHILTQRRSNYYFKRADWLNNQLEKGLTRQELDSFIEQYAQEKAGKPDTLLKTEQKYLDRITHKPGKDEILSEDKPADWLSKREREVTLTEMESPSAYNH